MPASGFTRVMTLHEARARATRLRFVPTKHGTLAVRVHGSGTPVLLIHGITDNLATWRSIQSALASIAETHAIDLPGHGLSDIPPRPYSIADQADAVIAYLDAAGIARCIVAGNSMGGGVALGVAARAHDRVEQLVLLNSIGVKIPPPVGLGMLRHVPIAELMPRIATSRTMRRVLLRDSFAPGFRPSEEVIERFWRAWQIEGRPAYLRGLTRSIDAAEPTPWLATIRTRAIVVHGDRDQMIPVESSVAIARALPNARSVLLRGVGHQPQIEAPMDTVSFIREALHERQSD